MKALIWKDTNKFELVEKDTPKILDERDAIVKVTMSSICTSDLHIIKGFVPKAKKGITLGHEFVGEIVQVGSAIQNLTVGDKVSSNCETFCGECFYCKKEYINNCENGGWKLGCSIDGCQAEYVRVPFADTGLTKLPQNVSYKNALFVGDILSSGWWGAKLCEINNGDTIAVIGSGPVGLCAMQCAKYLGAKVIALDIEDSRLKIAQEHSFADYIINPNKEDCYEIIKKLTSNRGVDGVIECAGIKTSFETAWQIARPNAIVAVVAMYEESQTLPLPDMYGKNLIFKTGGVDATDCKELLELISNNKLNTDFLISEEIHFEQIENAYQKFSKNNPELLKIALIY